MTLYLFNGYNYYNRIIERYNDISDYIELGGLLDIIENVNFNPNDGITTSQIINYNGAPPDYCIVIDDTNTMTRWFVIESRRTRAQQFEITLYRDVISDWYNEIINANTFIEKATIQDISDPFIFNSEDMTFNQIKKSETLLTDETGIPWLTLYLGHGTSETYDINVNAPQNNFYDIILSDSIDNWEWGKYQNTPARLVSDTITMFNLVQQDPTIQNVSQYGIHAASQDLRLYSYTNQFDATGYKVNEVLAPSVVYNLFSQSEIQEIINMAETHLPNTLSKTKYDEMMSLNGKTVFDSVSQKAYRIEITLIEENATTTESLSINSNLGAYIKTQLISVYNGNYKDNVIDLSIAYSSYIIRFADIGLSGTYQFEAKGVDRRVLEDAPYDIIAFPYPINTENGTVKYLYNGNTRTTNANISLNVVREILNKYGGNTSVIYDAQILPYCPINATVSNGIISIEDDTVPGKFLIKTGEYDVGFAIMANKANFTKNIEISGFDVPKNIIDKKVESLTSLWRFCSPNYNGAFDFNVIKNNGLNTISIDCTYRPINPYIHVAPVFSELYGADFNDSRGLICGGDFSLTIVNDAYLAYQRQNVNFQNIFDRQIQNLETTQDIARLGYLSSAVFSTVGSTAGGFATGGIPGAIAGAATGLATSGINIAGKELSYQEALDYRNDMFGYTLGNIRALPDSLSKSSSISYNNKLIPFIEYYTCTDEEKEALREKLKYNGMTIMRIAKIKDYINPVEKTYIKGKLIRLFIPEDYHVVNIISQELDKGVYI